MPVGLRLLRELSDDVDTDVSKGDFALGNPLISRNWFGVEDNNVGCVYSVSIS
jgi:hypothetical protein